MEAPQRGQWVDEVLFIAQPLRSSNRVGVSWISHAPHWQSAALERAKLEGTYASMSPPGIALAISSRTMRCQSSRILNVSALSAPGGFWSRCDSSGSGGCLLFDR